jgi:predicted ATP-grasp superfamily ATP-dependent carboligase
MRVLVLDGNENQAVACVRSLSRAGHSVTVGAETSWSKAGWSRHSTRTFTYTSPQTDANAFVEDVTAEARRVPGTLVLPLTERSTLPLSAARERIEAAGGLMVLPAHELLLRAFDKQQTTLLAQSLGISVPQTTLIGDSTQARAVATSLPYPVVLKPRTSEEISEGGRVLATGAPVYARDAGEFLAAYEQLSGRSSSILAQEFIEGTGGGYFALMREGELRAEFAHRRLRDVRPTGSGSSVRVSLEPAPALRAASLSILRELKWHGVAMVEFRLRADGTPVFLEVNGRFWNSLALAVYAGADFPAQLAHMAEHGDVERAQRYQAGVRCRWLLGDFRHLLEVWRGRPARFPGKFPSRWRTLFNFCAPVRNTFHDNFTWRDPLPELGDWLDFAFRRLPAGLRKRATARKEMHVQRGYSLP